MEIKIVHGNTGFLKTNYALIPTYQLSDREILLFDSGEEPSTALLEMLEEKNLRVRAVLCTHLHFDHIANNEALVSRYGTEIFAHSSEINAFQERHEVSYPITPISTQTTIDFNGTQIRVLETPGHSAGHLSYITPDDVCYFGDVMMSKEMLNHAKLPYMEDIDRSIASMEQIRQTQHSFYIAAHQGVISSEQLFSLVNDNIKKELDLYDLLRCLITQPTPVENAITNFMLVVGIQRQEFLNAQFMRNTTFARISALVNTGEFAIKKNLIVPQNHSTHSK